MYEKMAKDDAPLDDKAKRMQDLVSSFYSSDQSSVTNSNVSPKYATLDTINSPSFDPNHYMNLLVLSLSSFFILSFLVCFIQLIF